MAGIKCQSTFTHPRVPRPHQPSRSQMRIANLLRNYSRAYRACVADHVRIGDRPRKVKNLRYQGICVVLLSTRETCW